MADCRVEIREHFQHSVGQTFARRTRTEHRLHQRPVEQAFLAAGDADGDRLCLVLDRIDGAGELVDGPGQSRSDVVEQGLGRRDLSGVALVRLQRVRRHGGAQDADEANSRRDFEVAVVHTRGERVKEPVRWHADFGMHLVQEGRALAAALDGVFHYLARLSQRTSERINRHRRLIAKEVPDHHRQDEGNSGVNLGHLDDGCGGTESLLAASCDHDR